MKSDKTRLSTLFLGLAIFLGQFLMFGSRITFVNPHLPVITGVILVLLGISVILSIFSSKISVKRFSVIIFLILLAAISYLYTSSTTIPFLVLMPIAAKNTHFSKIIKIDLIAKIIVTLIVLFCYSRGLTLDRVFIRNGLVRETFGFIHPNQLGYICVIISLELFYFISLRKNARWILYPIVSIIPIMLCIMADSRTALIAIISATIIYIVNTVRCKKDKKKRKNKIVKRILLLPIILLAFSIISTQAYINKNEAAINLNAYTSGRLSLQKYYSEKYEISLLGNNIKDSDFAKKPLDNGYYRIMYSNGIVGVLALFTIVIFSLNNAIDNKKTAPTAIMIILLLYGLSEWTVFRLLATPFWVASFTKKDEANEE